MIPGLKIRGSSYRPPSASAWTRMVAEVRKRFPLDFPVRVSRARPRWAEADWAAGSLLYHEDGRTVGAHVWIDAKNQRSAAVDALLHEWAHLMCEEASSGEMLHDDRFWTTFGKLYRTWHREQ